MAKMDAKKIAEWQKAHPPLKIPEDVLATCGPWPSLEVNDFLGYARGRDMYPKEIVKLVEQLRDEVVWAYDMWTKSVHTDAQQMMRELMDNATGNDAYNFTRKFLQDYAHQNGFFIEEPEKEEVPPWRVAQEAGYVPPQPVLPKEAVDAGNVEPPSTTTPPRNPHGGPVDETPKNVSAK